MAIDLHPRRRAALPLRVGVVGLGTGTLAAYARPGDEFRFYEINPQVLELSSGPTAVFTYLNDAPGRAEIVLGDARLSLEREPPQELDVLALDAFTSDSIPAHLLTREAVAAYRRHLRAPDGVLAVHVSNKYLDLKPVVRGLARDLGWQALHVDSTSQPGEVWSSDWVVLRDPAGSPLDVRLTTAARELPAQGEGLVSWTDAWSNLWGVVKR
jgi:spermidine synthase